MAYIEIFPHGIQVSEKTIYWTNNQPSMIHGPIRFIPMEDIIDIIILEMILSYKVMDCLMIRIVSMDSNDDDDITGGNMKKRNRLFPLFSPYFIQLSREECEKLQLGIRQGIDSLRQY